MLARFVCSVESDEPMRAVERPMVRLLRDALWNMRPRSAVSTVTWSTSGRPRPRMLDTTAVVVSSMLLMTPADRFGWPSVVTARSVDWLSWATPSHRQPGNEPWKAVVQLPCCTTT